MGESSKPKSVRLASEHREKILAIRECLAPFCGDESDVIRHAIDFLHAEVVRDAGGVLQRIHCSSSSYDALRALRPLSFQQWLERCAMNKRKGIAS